MSEIGIETGTGTDETTVVVHPLVQVLLDTQQNLPKQGSSEWFSQRAKLLTCSRFGAILNHGHMSNQRYFREVTQQEAEEHNQRANVGAASMMNKGQLEEEDVRKFIQSLDPRFREIASFGCVVHSTVPGRAPGEELFDMFGGSPDGVIVETGMLIEIKNSIVRDLESGKLPPEYYDQVQGLMAVLNLEECLYVEYRRARIVNEQDQFQSVIIKRDRRYWEREMVPELLEFWDCVQDYFVCRRRLAMAQCHYLAQAVREGWIETDGNPNWQGASSLKARAVKSLLPALRAKWVERCEEFGPAYALSKVSNHYKRSQVRLTRMMPKYQAKRELYGKLTQLGNRLCAPVKSGADSSATTTTTTKKRKKTESKTESDDPSLIIPDRSESTFLLSQQDD